MYTLKCIVILKISIDPQSKPSLLLLLLLALIFKLIVVYMKTWWKVVSHMSQLWLWATKNSKEWGTQASDPRRLLVSILVMYRESTQKYHSSDKANTALSDSVRASVTLPLSNTYTYRCIKDYLQLKLIARYRYNVFIIHMWHSMRKLSLWAHWWFWNI